MEGYNEKKFEKRYKPAREPNKKLIIMVIVIILAALLGVGLGMFFINNNGNDKVLEAPSTRQVNGRLAKYIRGLGNEYYIRYMGEFGKTSINDTPIEATIEYTRNQEMAGIYSENLKLHVVNDNKYAYNILHDKRIIFKSSLPVLYNTEPYNLISDFGQVYIEEVNEEVAGVKYTYQEYEYSGVKIRYYFVGEDDLRYIRLLVGDTDRKINIRVDKKDRKELLTIPTDYYEMKA